VSRIIIPGARTASGKRKRALPMWLKGRASIYLDATDDRVTGTIPADLTGAGAFTLRGRLRSRVRVTATNRGAVAIGTNGADTGAFLGKVVVGGLEYYGGGLIGTTLADTVHCDQGEFADCMIRYAGGAGGALTLVVNGHSTSTVCTANITGVVAELGRLLVAGSCFGGLISDVLIDSRAISDAEYDAWRFGLEVATAPRRWWSGENPGYGTTVTEEIGKTADVMTGAVWDPAAPFKRARIVEAVAAAPDLTVWGRMITFAHHADIDQGSGPWGWMGWVRADRLGFQDKIVTKMATMETSAGWLLRFDATVLQPMLALHDGTTLVYIQISRKMDPSRWCHLGVSADGAGAQVRVFRDAQRPVIGTAPAGSLSNVANLVVGRSAPGNGIYGSVNDEVWVKGRAPTWDEIEAHYYDGIEPTAPAGSVQIAWGMREGAGTTVVSRPAGYNGTLSAASWTTSTRCPARTAA
jgi:hypothetical protein